MNRHSLIQLLIGVIAAVAGLTTMIFIRQDRCLDAGGAWSAQTRRMRRWISDRTEVADG